MLSILVPTDFSNNATLALKYAAQIASEFGFEVHLLHVFEMPLFERFLVEEEVKPVSEEHRNQMFTRYLEKTFPDGTIPDNLQIRSAVRQGNVTTEVQKYAKETEPLLIIVGSQGSGSDQWDKIMLGGTAQKIIRRMEIPVMMIPPDATYKPLKKFAYATDFNPEDLRILDELIAFSRHFGADVSAVHIKKDQWDWDEARAEKLRTQFEKELAAGTLKFEVSENPDVIAGLDEFIAQNDISLLALLKKPHNLWDRLVDQSTAIKIALHSHIPTIVFKE